MEVVEDWKRKKPKGTPLWNNI